MVRVRVRYRVRVRVRGRGRGSVRVRVRVRVRYRARCQPEHARMGPRRGKHAASCVSQCRVSHLVKVRVRARFRARVIPKPTSNPNPMEGIAQPEEERREQHRGEGGHLER